MPQAARAVEFRILGTLEVHDDGRVHTVSGKPAALLAALLLEAGRLVPRDRVIDELWGDEPPDTAAKAVQVFAARLRKAIPELPLRTQGSAYVLEIEPRQLDLGRFEELASEGRDALSAGDAARAAEMLQDALALWRGPALAGIDEPFARAAAARLEALRISVLEHRVDADLALGRHDRVVTDLESAIAAEPHRERLRAQLMLALYRCRRQVEALKAYQEARRALVDELGVEPSSELQRLHRMILQQDPALEPPSPATPPSAGLTQPATRRRRPRRTHLAVAGVFVLAAALAAAAVFLAKRSPEMTIPERALGLIDPATGEFVSSVPLDTTPAFMAAAEGSLWTATSEGTVARIDARQRRVSRTFVLGSPPSGLAVGLGGVWVGQTDPRPGVVRISPSYGTIAERVRIPPTGERASHLGSGAPSVVVGGSAVWVASGETTVSRIDPQSPHVVTRIYPPSGATGALAYGANALWIGGTRAVGRLSPRSNILVSTRPLQADPVGLAVHGGVVWAALENGTVVRIDAFSEHVTASVSIGARPTAIAATEGSVWVVSSSAGEVVRIDSRSARVTGRIATGATPIALAVSRDGVWVGTR